MRGMGGCTRAGDDGIRGGGAAHGVANETVGGFDTRKVSHDIGAVLTLKILSAFASARRTAQTGAVFDGRTSHT